MGLFINTLPIRVDIDRDSVEESVRSTHLRLAALMEHEHASLALTQRCSSVPTGVPLFSALLNYRHNSTYVSNHAAAFGMETLESEERTNYPFNLSVEDYGTSLGLTAIVVQPYDPSRICGYMQEALDSLTAALEYNPSMSVSNLEVLPIEERQLLLSDWNRTQERYPDALCLHHLFEQQVERTPGAIAVVHGEQSMTYAEVNARANSLAYKLIQLGAKPEALVAVCVERSMAMIIGIFAVLKAGAAYVPLDPSHTSGRLCDILRDTSPLCVIVDQIGKGVLGPSLSSVLVIDPNDMATSPASNPPVPALISRHLAYVIFTSGTTGKPNGVMIEHQGVVSYVMSQQKDLRIQPSSRMIQFFSIGFDASVLEIFCTLCFGGSLHLLHDDDRMDRNLLWLYLEQHHITHALLTPSVLHDCDRLSPLSTMSVLLVGGESLSPTLVRKLRTLAPDGTVINMYGPTEATVAATSWIYSEHGLLDDTPIGRPLANTTVYLLDAYRNPVPLGAIGEIHIGGVGVARGYLNRPETTAERFIADPFTGGPQARMYKTGDLARYLPDGNIVYVGRSDHQVKIRGFRVEVREIEARLREYSLVSKAVVVALGDEIHKYLVAYVILQQENQLDPNRHGLG
ncbi:hypothetical protein BGX28_000762, partial [Mortierella sp. GBA30]